MAITPGQAHNIGKAGGKNHFNLGVGKTSGHVNITENVLEAGYALPSGSAGGAAYYMSADGTAVVFEVPLDGARTSTNTKYPRVEYRELVAGGSGDSDTGPAVWNGATGDHYVEHWFRVTKLPPNRPEVVTHQIHGPSDDTAKIKWVGRGSTAKLVATYDDFDYATIASGLTLGTWYYAKLRAFNGDLEWYFGEGTTTPAARKDNATLVQVAGQYFKAGAYAQTYGGPAAGRSGGPYDEISDGPVIVEIRTGSLVCWHTGYPPPTGSTGAPTVSAGADATATVGATFVRSATETGSSITSRTWKIQSGPTGVGSTIDSDANLAWTPTTVGSYVLRFSATNSSGTGTDDVTVVVTSGGDEDEDNDETGTLVYPLEYPDGTPYPVIGSGSTTVSVSTSGALTSALSAATAGQKIVLANGTYSGSFTISGKTATASNGISVEAATTGGASFASGSTFTVKDCQHVTVKGLTFPYDTPGDVFGIRGACKWVRVTRCTFGPTTLGSAGTESGNFIYVGDDTSVFRIDHNEFRNKAVKGNCVRVYGNFTSYKGCTYGRIDHNIFRQIKPAVGNDKEPIRYGVSTMSRTVANAVIERNYFTDCLCEPELTSVKMGRIRVSGNTYYRCAGGVVIRHGTDSIQSDNYVTDGNNTSYVDPVNGNTIGSGGTRFYDASHDILNNYYGNLTGAGNFQRALLLDTGDAEGSSPNLSAHWRVVNAKVSRNVIVNCLTGIVVGDNYSTAPSGVELSDNITAGIGSGTPPITYVGGITLVGSPAPSGNLNFATPAAGGFTLDGDGIWRKAGFGPRMTYIKQSDVGPVADLTDTDGTGVPLGGSVIIPTVPVVNAGGGATVLIGDALARTATESGTGITTRRWTIEAGPTGSGTLLSTTASVTWAPSAVGSYVLRYAATNANGTGTNDITVLVTTGGGEDSTPPTFVGVGAGSSGQSSSMELAAPPGIQDRDFQIAAIISAGAESIVTLPPGWTLMDSALVYSPAGARGGPCIAWLFSTTDPVTGPATWTKSGGRTWHGVRAAWRGQSALGAHAVIGETTGSTNHPIPTVVPAGPNARVVGIVMADLLNATPGPFTPPTGWSERYDETKTSGTENESITIADVVN